MFAVILTSVDSTSVIVNATSLKHIDEIIAGSGTFNILEIVPDTKGASFGYYVDEQEPISTWKTTLSGFSSPAERSDYVNDLFTRLADKGILSGTETTALKYQYYDDANGLYYTEAYIVDDELDWNILRLDTSESVFVTGTFTPSEDGAYRAEYSYSPDDSGGYIQYIARFEYTQTPDYIGGAYYYAPIFTELTPETDLIGMDDTVVYQIEDEDEEIEIEIYIIIGTVGSILDGDGFDLQQQYYYVDPFQTGAPGTHNYEAIVDYRDSDDAPHDGFIVPSSGESYFTRTIEDYSYVVSGGNYDFSDSGSDVNTVHFIDVYYQAGYVNNNLFKRLVFGLEDTNLSSINVTVTVRQASSVTAGDIAAADMIYLSSGTDITQSDTDHNYTETNDIQDAQAAAIYNLAINDYPVLIDYAIIDGITEVSPPSEINTIEKLCLLSLESTDGHTGISSLSEVSVDWPSLAYMIGDTDKTFVNNNIYCFNAFSTVSLSYPDNIEVLVTELFNEPFSADVTSNGFLSILAEIQNENFLRQIAGETEMLSENITVSASVRHIINYKGRRESSQKTSIRVLDLQPAKVTASSWLTVETVQGWTDDPVDGPLPADQISIVHIATGEFIGKIEDINETYDMIYIGMSTESLNTYLGSTVYNDTHMNGLIYTNIGDTYYATIEMAGIRSQDYITVNGTKAIDGTQGTTANLFRFSGNDITKTTVTELEKFARAGYPIILADGFVSGGSINTTKVDSSSYMYQATNNIYGTYTNIISESQAAADPETVVQYLNVSKPMLDIMLAPIEYVDESTYLTSDDDGYIYLTYEISISNVTDSTPVSTTYDCRLFLDLNADGRYADNEELDDIEVRLSDGTLILPLSDEYGGEFYTLYADVDYSVKRQMPEDYVGIISWKLGIIKNGADQIHASEQGFTRIAANSNVQTIKVLQIMQEGTEGSKLNLSQQLTVNPYGSNTQLRGIDGQYYTGIYGKLIADLADFNVIIDVIENDNLEDMNDSNAILDYLSGYDMLIIGFNDVYDGIHSLGAEAIVQYINTGRSVLFTHDTTSLTQVPYENYPMAIDGSAPNSITLDGSDIVWNSVTSQYKSIDGNVDWYGSYSSTPPPYLEQDNPTYVIFMTSDIDSTNENDYFNAKAGYSGNYQIYKINNINSIYDVDDEQVTSVYSRTSLDYFKSTHSNATIVYCAPGDVSGWYRTNYSGYDLSVNGTFTKFDNGNRYNCTDMTFQDYRRGRGRTNSINNTSYDWIIYCLASDRYPDDYSVVGTYNGSTYSISGTQYYPASGAAFPTSTLYDGDPSDSYELSVIPHGIADWGYYFNTVIRDSVGLDRYGISNTMLNSIVDVTGSMSYEDIATVLSYNRGVAYTPKSGGATTVDETQGYTNYALIRFAESGNTYRYTNNNYNNRQTRNISQVNKGQITTYPYDVNTENFGGTNSTITGYGDTYMEIGLTHEQYFQINMNTDDIVVWYCLSSGGTDNNSYYDDVPNDSVNAYYIYNKSNVTYSGVGHTSNAYLYTGSSIGQEYINEAMLFVNTMIAAYRAADQNPTVEIKKDARGTTNQSTKFILVDEDVSAEEVLVLPQEIDNLQDARRAVYFRIYDPSLSGSNTITVNYYVADSNGTLIDGIDENVSPLVTDEEGLPLTTYEANSNNAVTALNGGRVYKFYLPNGNCLDKFRENGMESISIYVQIVTDTMTGPLPYDTIELKKQQLYLLS